MEAGGGVQQQAEAEGKDTLTGNGKASYVISDFFLRNRISLLPFVCVRSRRRPGDVLLSGDLSYIFTLRRPSSQTKEAAGPGASLLSLPAPRPLPG